VKGPARAAALALLAGAAAAAAWLVARAETPQQPFSLGVVRHLGAEAAQGVDRVGKTLTRVPDAEEIEIGRVMAVRAEFGYPKPNDLREEQRVELARRQRYVDAVVATLVADGRLRRPGLPYHGVVLQSGVWNLEANALALPGGHVYITTALLDLLETEAEVAAVLGHEIAHVDLRHCIERIQVRVHAERLDPAATPATMLAVLGEAALRAGFDDEQEAEADRQGVVYAAHAGYHPDAGPAALRRLAVLAGEAGTPRRDRLDREVEGMLRDALDDYFRTHPHGPERVARLERAVREQRLDAAGRRWYVGRENRRLWVPRAERELPQELIAGRLPPDDPGRAG
jgi:predicted Zn-dependent protease